jgi:PEP-CTERM motif
MTKFTNRFLKVLAPLGFLTALSSAQAGFVTVGGINFDDSLLPGHLETTTLAETLITGNGQTLSGYGVVNTVNGNFSNVYCAVGTCQLYFTFTDYVSQNFSPTSTEFSAGVISVYLNNGAPLNLTGTASATNFATIQGLTPWVQFTGVDNLAGATSATSTLLADGTLLGSALLSFTGSGLAEVNAGWGIAAVEAFLDGNSELNALGYGADLTITTSGSNSYSRIPNVDKPECFSGTTQASFIGTAGDWCIQGSADISGTTVIPEPGTLALVGLAMLGAGAMRRRSKR